jgi:peptidoglycan/xylan/chitin deacetylase (PgdA/CDA1 family)
MAPPIDEGGAAGQAPGEQPVPILMYHALVAEGAELAGRPRGVTRYWTQVGEFERQVRALAERGFAAVSLSSLLPGARPVSVRRPLVVTFDDGWASDVALARPILGRLGWTSEHFVTVDWIGTRGFMSWRQLRQLAQDGCGVQSHTMSHRDLDALGPRDVRRELQASKAVLERRLGRPVEFLGLPGGRGATALVVTQARSLGYRGICTSTVGVHRRGADPYALHRLPVTRGTTVDDVLGWVEGRGLTRVRLMSRVSRLARRLLGIRLYEGMKERLAT